MKLITELTKLEAGIYCLTPIVILHLADDALALVLAFGIIQLDIKLKKGE